MKDIFKKSFIEGFTSADLSARSVVVALAATFVIGIFIFFIYRLVTRKTFYSREFNISLICVALITAGIIIVIQSSIVISLGMVGALSIVRFRTAIKNPMDLVFLFWAISIGIICGAGLVLFAVLLSLLLSITILAFNKLPNIKTPMILVINCSNIGAENTLLEKISLYSKYYSVKSRNINSSSMDLTIEIRTETGEELIKDLMNVKGVISASLLQHDGEIAF